MVTGDVPPYAVFVANRGCVARYRFEEAPIARLLTSTWWTPARWRLEGIDLSRPAQSIERRVAESKTHEPELIHVTELV